MTKLLFLITLFTLIWPGRAAEPEVRCELGEARASKKSDYKTRELKLSVGGAERVERVYVSKDGAHRWRLPVDKAALEEHVKAAYDLPARVKLVFGDPKPSPIPGFDVVAVRVRGVGETERLYLSKDGRYYLFGKFKDLSVHPYQERMSKIDLKDPAVRGDADAPVTVVEYTDFQCYFCKKGYLLMRDKILKEFPGKVRWVYKSLPLTRIHPWAKDAAIGAECVRRQGMEKFWVVHDAIFDDQRSITVSNLGEMLEGYAKKAGADLGRFTKCYDSKATAKLVTSDMSEASLVGVNSTPSFVINGRVVSGADERGLRRAITELLPAKKAE